MPSITQPIKFADIKFVSFADIHLDYLDILMKGDGLEELVVAYIKGENGNFILTEPAVNGELYEFLFGMVDSKGWLVNMPKLNPPIMLKLYYHNGMLVADAKNVPVKNK